MVDQITIEMSPHVAQRAALVAARSHRPIEEVVRGWLEWAVDEIPVGMLPDHDLMVLAESCLPPEQQADLDSLLERNAEGTLDDDGRRQLDDLMAIYEHGLLRKAQALREAVRRGLRGPLEP